ncbi:ABC transporter substrate-binding protein|uniref:Iron complex transport system substrate-binding protein n=1 Tax=Dendrosporobacter quercicolus TaxID=146817 RepID=A0A1G9VCC3_9FIRM|nr:ABC transporter substrate-binding protein [Dendrosporobacter quercicolus]NSL47856.1 ABC transporter substrate-binding protein [Dendrosporobacter quercicolus DSM 1736]SDM69707.1 iron complex transport system substrate-binding protein [Dendrosporobacter quercicolus]
MMAGYENVKELKGTLPSIRCNYCNRLLYRGVVQAIEIKCPKCAAVQSIKGCRSIKPGGNIAADSVCLPKKAGGNAPVRVVTDGAGRVVAIPERPQRVIALNASNISLYYAAGGHVVGRVATNMLDPDIAEQVCNIPTVGFPFCPDREKIIDMRPDLVLGIHAPMHHSLVISLEKAGIAVLLQVLERYDDVLKTFRLYGELSGNPEQAGREIESIEEKRRGLVRRHWRSSSPKVLILWEADERLYTACSNSFIGDLVKRLGGVNVADMAAPIEDLANYTPFRLAAVEDFQPDLVLVIRHRLEFVTSILSGDKPVSESAVLRQLEEMCSGRVYILPYRLFAVNPGPQLGEALAVLDGLLYGTGGM